MTHSVTNTAASVRARLLNRAKAEHRPFDELLQYFAMERFLFRLSRSHHVGEFVLKGALMLPLWGGPVTRPTRDIDLLGRVPRSVPEVLGIVLECLQQEVEDDGLVFDPRSVAGEEIRITARYNGVRVRFLAFLGNAKVAIQVDVGFGDATFPEPVDLRYPSQLDFSEPHIQGYAPEAAIAEKFQAMVELDMANSRMKDFLDIWVLAKARDFDGQTLARALESTFGKRAMPLPASRPVALTPVFFESQAKQTQWQAFLRKGRIRGQAPSLPEATSLIAGFLVPVVDALNRGRDVAGRWPAGGPWAT